MTSVSIKWHLQGNSTIFRRGLCFFFAAEMSIEEGKLETDGVAFKFSGNLSSAGICCFYFYFLIWLISWLVKSLHSEINFSKYRNIFTSWKLWVGINDKCWQWTSQKTELDLFFFLEFDAFRRFDWYCGKMSLKRGFERLTWWLIGFWHIFSIESNTTFVHYLPDCFKIQTCQVNLVGKISTHYLFYGNSYRTVINCE